MDPLTQLLVQRELAAQPQQQPLPAVPPNNSTKVPQAEKRFRNAQAIQDAYRTGDTNPIILRLQLGHR